MMRPIREDGGEILIEPLAAESLGIRSLCTFVTTPDVKVLLDPGVSHGLRSLLPHPREAEALLSAGRRILARAKEAQVLTISHYHFDHYMPAFTHWMNFSSPELATLLYRGKEVLLKARDLGINFSQRKRSYYLYQRRDCTLRPADGERFRYGETEIKFSPPFDHGEEGTKLGKVLLCTISTPHERFLFAPDVQGPMVEETLEYILAEEPDLLLIGGPPTYLRKRIKAESLSSAKRSLLELARRIPRMIVDHHLLRDPDWGEFLAEAKEAASSRGHELLCAAEFLGEEVQNLEAHRAELYAREPPPDDWEERLRRIRTG
ncbi:TPA: MBL fold metallo-hydrolase [Candidatus Bipolaricaulota bacterium]|nr:MBL fold metallo-hydrolase [Candidatus Bipolaricaulota bacterium]